MSREVFTVLLNAASPELRRWMQQRPQTILNVLARVSNLELGTEKTAYAEVLPSYAAGNILASELGAFKARLESLARRAQKMGLPAPKVAYGEPFWEKLPRKDWEYTDTFKQLIPVTLDMPAVQLPGWQFQAKVEHRQTQDGGFANLVKLAPGIRSLPTAYRTAGPQCEHCNTKRWRNDTFVLEKDGKRIRVGRQCLRDFIGREDAETLIALASYIDELRGMASEEGEGGGGYGNDRVALTRAALVRAAQDVREFGYRSRKKADAENMESTADSVRFMVFPPRDLPEHKRPKRPLPGDEETADAALAWIRAAPASSDFMYNAKTIAAQDYIRPDDLGILVAIIPAYLRDQGARLEAQAAGESTYLGKVGDRFGGSKKTDPPPLAATILRRITTQSVYGTSTLFTLRTPQGSDLLWFMSGNAPPEFREGVKVLLSGTVKAHTLDKTTQRPTTQLTRGSIELAK